MLHQVLDIFNIIPNYDLDIMSDNQTLSSITVKALSSLDKIIKQENSGLVLVHGDTTTTLSGSLTAFYNKVKVGHVEAVLRTYNKHSPFPEEINRKLTSNIADFHFAPTETLKQNLLKEGIDENQIFVTGNTAIDALKTTVEDNYYHPLLDKINNDRIILLTAHIRENLGFNMENMFKAIKRILGAFDDIQVVYPIHLNPKVRETARRIFIENERIHIIEPLDVIDFHNFMNKSYLIMTDSGGIQEESPSLGKPVIVLRDTTERPEGIKAGTLKLAGVDEESIYGITKQLLTDNSVYDSMAKACNPYGDGNASRYIANIIIEKLN